MRVQKIEKINGNGVTYIVIGDNFIPFQTINEYLEYMENSGKSHNTIKNYAFHINVYFNFLAAIKIEWNEINTKTLHDYVRYLKIPDSFNDKNIIPFSTGQEFEPRRSASTINVMMAAVISFYKYHARLDNAPDLQIYSESGSNAYSSYKPFLHHISKGSAKLKNELKAKVPKRIPKTISQKEFKLLVEACNNSRDKFILCLLYESGIRIGQALGLRHSDISLPDNEIKIVPRTDNENLVFAKTNEEYTVHITEQTMALYTEYIFEDLENIESDYVFVNVWGGIPGRPMRYANVVKIFNRLKKKTGIRITPHMLRHTHATEFVRQGGRMDILQRRLGHKSIQTTTNIYTHASNEDMKKAHKEFLQKRQERKEGK